MVSIPLPELLVGRGQAAVADSFDQQSMVSVSSLLDTHGC